MHHGRPYIVALLGALALLAACSSKKSSPVKVIPIPAPQKPNLVQTGPGEVKMSWVAVDDSRVSFYGVYRSPDGSDFKKLNDTKAASYTDSALQQGSTIYYRLTSVTASGLESDPSEQASLKITPPPFAPSGMSALAGSSKRIDLGWIDNSLDETGFVLERKEEASGSYTLLTSPGADVSAYSDASIRAGTIYYYRALAYNVAGKSAYSNEASAFVCAWSELGTSSYSGGGISSTNGISEHPFVAMTPGNLPAVAWDDASSGARRIYMKRFDGFGWVEVSNGSASDVGVSELPGESYLPWPAADPSGNITLSWVNSDSGVSKMCARRLSGRTWYEIGTGSFLGQGISDGDAAPPELQSAALDNSGMPLLAWPQTVSGQSAVFVKKFDGTNWVEVGAGSASGSGVSNEEGSANFPVLITDKSARPVVFWIFNMRGVTGVHARVFDGTSWVEMPAGSATGTGISQSANSKTAPSVAKDPAGNIYVAWAGATNVFALKYDGANWVEVGAGSSTGTGISNSQSQGDRPAIAIGPKGGIYLAWIESMGIGSSGAKSEVYMKKFNGTAWVEVEAGSAKGGGISSNGGQAYFVSLAVDTLGNPVAAWSDDASGDREIYVKTYKCR